MSFNTGDKVLFNNEFEGEVLAYDEEIKGCNYAVKIKAKNGYKLVKAKILEEHQEMDQEFEGIAEMIEFRPENLSKDSLNELLDDIKDIADNNYGKWRRK